MCKLTKALYGLKRAPRAWFSKLSAALHQIGFKATRSNVSLFTQVTPTSIMYILVYVDDIIVIGTSAKDVAALIQNLNSTFALKDMGPLHYFLRIKVHHTSIRGFLLSQTKYIKDLLHKAKMSKYKPYPTLMTSNLKLSSSDGVPLTDPNLYRSIVGSLQYVTITRLELAFCVTKVCQFMQNPLDTHWKTVKRILKYLSGTSSFSLHLQRCSSLPLTGYLDTDWDFDPDDRKSTARYGVYLGKNLISWASKKQHSIS